LTYQTVVFCEDDVEGSEVIYGDTVGCVLACMHASFVRVIWTRLRRVLDAS